MKMLLLDVTKPDEADQALGQMGILYTWLFDEIKYHLGELEREWPQLEERVLALGPPDTDEETGE